MNSLAKKIDFIDRADDEGVSLRLFFGGEYQPCGGPRFNATVVVDMSGDSVERQRMAFLESSGLYDAGLVSRIGFVEDGFHEIDFEDIRSTRKVWFPRKAFDYDSFYNALPPSEVVVLVTTYETLQIDQTSFEALANFLKRTWGLSKPPHFVVRCYESNVLFEEFFDGLVYLGGDNPKSLGRLLRRLRRDRG